MKNSSVLFAAAFSVIGFWSRNAKAGEVGSYAVFGGTGVTYGGFSTTTGTVGSNLDINLLSASTTIGSVQAYRNFNGSGDDQTITGEAAANGLFSGGSLSSYGNLDVGGSAIVQGSVAANVTVGGNLNTSAYVNVGGNEFVGGNASIGWVNKIPQTLGVNGNVSLGIYSNIGTLVYGGTLIDDSTTTIGRATQGTVTVNPQPVSLVTIPPPTTFTAGGVNETLPLFASQTLAPGQYGALTFNGSNTLTLTAGNYYFSSIQSVGEFTTLNLNLSGGMINIYVAGNVDLEAVNENINGVSFANANPALASYVYLQALGSVTIDGTSPANGSHFFGTIYDPTGSITTGVNETFTGSLLSGQSVTIGGANINYEPSEFLAPDLVSLNQVPEPSATMLIASLGALMLGRRRRSNAGRRL